MFINKTTVKNFKQRSEDVISVFTKTIADLSKINSEIEDHNTDSQKTIDILNNQIEENKAIITINQKVITNCSKILE